MCVRRVELVLRRRVGGLFFVCAYLFCDHYQRFTIPGFRTTAQVYINNNNTRTTDQHKKDGVPIYKTNTASFAVFILFRVILEGKNSRYRCIIKPPSRKRVDIIIL